ncbi:hypothetical protein SAMN04488116_1777 [Flagellimonas flava]|uniref:Uncharacterized protein n=1 Tax=Flagellimonas flava TaxID=570519 RepID=A0A1M5KU08_9FLAO|nr:hypothetical protein SAMN04488116_1777 [Allomuricauda flava]
MYSSNTTRRGRLLSRDRFDFGSLFTRARWGKQYDTSGVAKGILNNTKNK